MQGCSSKHKIQGRADTGPSGCKLQPLCGSDGVGTWQQHPNCDGSSSECSHSTGQHYWFASDTAAYQYHGSSTTVIRSDGLAQTPPACRWASKSTADPQRNTNQSGMRAQSVHTFSTPTQAKGDACWLTLLPCHAHHRHERDIRQPSIVLPSAYVWQTAWSCHGQAYGHSYLGA